MATDHVIQFLKERLVTLSVALYLKCNLIRISKTE